MSSVVLLGLRLVLAGLLYSFLAWALYTVWRDLKYQARLQPLEKMIPIKLIFGADNNSQLHTFAQSEVIIGRSGNCDIKLDDKTISARHTHLAFRHGQWWVEDMSSTNGTYLNDDLVVIPVVLTNGDQIRCGQVSGRVMID